MGLLDSRFSFKTPKYKLLYKVLLLSLAFFWTCVSAVGGQSVSLELEYIVGLSGNLICFLVQ